MCTSYALQTSSNTGEQPVLNPSAFARPPLPGLCCPYSSRSLHPTPAGLPPRALGRHSHVCCSLRTLTKGLGHAPKDYRPQVLIVGPELVATLIRCVSYCCICATSLECPSAQAHGIMGACAPAMALPDACTPPLGCSRETWRVDRPTFP